MDNEKKMSLLIFIISLMASLLLIFIQVTWHMSDQIPSCIQLVFLALDTKDVSAICAVTNCIWVGGFVSFSSLSLSMFIKLISDKKIRQLNE